MWLCEEEQTILRFLEHCGEAGASAREVCRKASTKDAWKENERWAYPFLASLKDKKAIETNAGGAYRIPPKADD